MSAGVQLCLDGTPAPRLDPYARQKARHRANPDPIRARSQMERARRAGAKVVELVLPSVVFKRDGGVCQICFEPVSWDALWPDPAAAAVDHITAIANGGNHIYANCQLAHHGCNWRKGVT